MKYKIPEDYDSPINISVNKIAEQMAVKIDEGVMQAVARVGLSIDKDKLVEILKQDKGRYSKAYKRGYNEGYKKRDEEIKRCDQCIYYSEDVWCKLHKRYVLYTDHCSFGAWEDEAEMNEEDEEDDDEE